MRTSNFVGPTKNNARAFVENLWTPKYEFEGLQEKFQNQRALYLMFVQSNNHLKMRDRLKADCS